MWPVKLLVLQLILVRPLLAADGPPHASGPLGTPPAAATPAGPVTLEFIPPAAGQDRYRLVEPTPSAADQAVEIRGSAGETLISIVQVTNPPVASHQYVVRGRVKYENVAGTAYLEMWNDFGERGAYFSRTLADAGPLRSISGTSDWRDIALPFTAKPGMKPARITINVAMPAAGTIFLSPLTIQSDSSVATWWSPSQRALVEGVGGGALGLLGGAIGILTSLRRSRKLVVVLLVIGSVCGVGLLAAGAVSLLQSQPFFVAYPLLLMGSIATLVFGLNARPILRRYREEELRKMTALDA